MYSEIRHHGPAEFPTFTSVRVMHMPFDLCDLSTLPEEIGVDVYRPLVRSLLATAPVHFGTGYITIDEAVVPAGQTHRRPGLHVDGGVGRGWGGGGGGWGKAGMIVAASHLGCVAWNQHFDGSAGDDGECEHLAQQCCDATRVDLRGGQAYFLGPLCVHDSLPMLCDTPRQFLRISMPNDAPWFDGYTRNPTGVKPTGPVRPARSAQMAFRP